MARDQIRGDEHVCVALAQSPEQHSAELAQVPPSGTHEEPFGSHRPRLHAPLQQSAARRHGSPSGVHVSRHASTPAIVSAQ